MGMETSMDCRCITCGDGPPLGVKLGESGWTRVEWVEFPPLQRTDCRQFPSRSWGHSVHRAYKQRKARNMTRIDRFDSLRPRANMPDMRGDSPRSSPDSVGGVGNCGQRGEQPGGEMGCYLAAQTSYGEKMKGGGLVGSYIHTYVIRLFGGVMEVRGKAKACFKKKRSVKANKNTENLDGYPHNISRLVMRLDPVALSAVQRRLTFITLADLFSMGGR
ncbi:hypothetical protein QBC32DRAFT_90728 [Pseudoneurospora amorphoporcata]|uniref:Uncharacterized protein n=1 Tax=Pseudoneurospora amorphoporcata TaxID=241081 RepID=A0AAN6NYE5_9PEZI|nr:hypothetical protein QBC32DRAFT_90728 [Pseudoneurospora amorphoporcata]